MWPNTHYCLITSLTRQVVAIVPEKRTSPTEPVSPLPAVKEEGRLDVSSSLGSPLVVRGRVGISTCSSTGLGQDTKVTKDACFANSLSRQLLMLISM